jgi:hypothetical protein
MRAFPYDVTNLVLSILAGLAADVVVAHAAVPNSVIVTIGAAHIAMLFFNRVSILLLLCVESRVNTRENGRSPLFNL